MRPAAIAFLLLAGATVCGGGRDFRPATSLTEYRPTRAATTTTIDDAAEAFRATPPARAATKPPPPQPLPTEVRLSNGIRVVMLERHDFPSISAVLVLDRGASAAGPGVAQLYSTALLGTSNEYKSKEAFQYLNFVGAEVIPRTGRDAITLQVTALSPLFVSALSRAAPMFTAPSLDGDEIDEARTQLAAMHARADTNPVEVAHDALYAAIFAPPHPYGTPVSGQPARLGRGAKGERAAAEVTNAAVKGFRASNLTAEHLGVAVVGDFKPAAIQHALEAALGKVPKEAGTKAPPMPAVAPKSGRKMIVIDRPGAAQSSLAIGWPGVRAADPDLVALEVLAAATGGDMSTRLNLTVRKELGASYGVHMAAIGLRDAGLVTITAATDTARTVDALRGMFKELDRLRTEPLSAAELFAAKLRTFDELEHGSTRGLAGDLARAIVEDRPPMGVLARSGRVELVTGENVRAAAEHYLAMDEVRVVVVGDAGKLVEGLRTLGAFEVSVVATP
jgi:zinc protease